MFTELGRDRRSSSSTTSTCMGKMVALLYSIDFKIIDRDLYVWFSINCFPFGLRKIPFLDDNLIS